MCCQNCLGNVFPVADRALGQFYGIEQMLADNNNFYVLFRHLEVLQPFSPWVSFAVLFFSSTSVSEGSWMVCRAAAAQSLVEVQVETVAVDV